MLALLDDGPVDTSEIFDMINRMKQNRAIIPSKRSRFKEDIREGIYSNEHRVNRLLSRDDLSTEEKQRIKRRIRAKAARSRRRDVRIYSVSALIVLLFIFLLYRLMI